MAATWTPGVLADGTLSGALADMFVVPSGEIWRIDACNVANTTAGVLALTLALNPRTAGTDRTIIAARNIGVSKDDLCAEAIGQYIEGGGKLRGLGNGLSYFVSGLKIVP